MKVSVIFEDGTIVVDRVSKSGFVFNDTDPNWRVIQWDENCGWIEVCSGERVWLADISTVQPFVDMYAAQVEPEPFLVPESITRRQCALELYARQIITLEEALAMTKTAEVPVAIAQVFDAAVTNGQMTADQRMLAEIDFAAINYYRANSLLGFMGLTDLQIDEFFVAAAQR